MQSMRSITLALPLSWLLMACAYQPIEQSPIMEGTEMSLEQTARWAQIDHANRLEVPLDAVSIVEAREVIWSSGAVGCPQPDRFYTQALVDGYLVILMHGQEKATYHAIRGRSPFLCPADRRERPIELGESIY